MKNLSIALNVILLILVIILFVMVNNLKKGMGEDNSAMPADNNKTLRIAYVNADSINSTYQMMKDFKNEVQAKQMQMQEVYDQKAKKLQAEYEAYVQKKQAGNISEIDDKKAQQDIQNKKTELDEMQQGQQDLLKDVQAKNLEIEKTVQDYITSYNKTAHFDYVLGYESIGGTVLFANNSFDITKQIVGGLNQQYKDSLQKTPSGPKQ